MRQCDKRTLCPRCLSDYHAAGYVTRRDYAVVVKDECDICGRSGFDYWITDEKEKQ